MSGYNLRLIEDQLAAHCQITLPDVAGFRVVYVARGSVAVTPEGGTGEELGENTGRFGATRCAATAGRDGATLWRWELVQQLDEDWQGDGEGAASALKAAHGLELDAGQEYMMRCDRVDFPPGGVAYTHVHAGPGLRCLLRGELSVQVDEQQDTVVRPGETWFERGPDPVYAQASDTELTSFVRSMVLPRSYKGRSSITYVKAEDADKPKPQEYTRYVDEFVEL